MYCTVSRAHCTISLILTGIIEERQECWKQAALTDHLTTDLNNLLQLPAPTILDFHTEVLKAQQQHKIACLIIREGGKLSLKTKS